MASLRSTLFLFAASAATLFFAALPVVASAQTSVSMSPSTSASTLTIEEAPPDNTVVGCVWTGAYVDDAGVAQCEDGAHLGVFLFACAASVAAMFASFAAFHCAFERDRGELDSKSEVMLATQ
jgi:hypothetical protein